MPSVTDFRVVALGIKNLRDRLTVFRRHGRLRRSLTVAVSICKHALAVLSRARKQAGFGLFQQPASLDAGPGQSEFCE
jgi:hypothetical protein